MTTAIILYVIIFFALEILELSPPEVIILIPHTTMNIEASAGITISNI